MLVRVYIYIKFVVKECFKWKVQNSFKKKRVQHGKNKNNKNKVGIYYVQLIPRLITFQAMLVYMF